MPRHALEVVVFRGITVLGLRRIGRRWLPFASIPLVLALALGALALRAQPHPVASTLPPCSTPDSSGTACPSPSPSATDSATATATATDTPSATPTPTAAATADPTATATARPTAAPFPSTGESAVLIPCGAVAGDDIGRSVAITPDGNEVVTGASNTNNQDGAAYVLVRTATGWQQAARLTVADAPEGGLGNAVAVSADGSTALVAAEYAHWQGKVYVFSRSAGGWAQTAELNPTNVRASNDTFGQSLSLSADGNTAAISEPKYNGSGFAYIFTRSGSGWKPSATLEADSPQPADGFGVVLALDAAGTRLALGYPTQSSVLMYDLAGGAWTRTATLTVAGSSQLGSEVALSSDGTTALAGDSGFYSSTASVSAFRETGGTWSNAGELTGPTPTNGGFGVSLALAADGSRALAGDYGPRFPTGTAFAYDGAGGSWGTAQQLRSPKPSANDLYGAAVALDGSGSVAAIGANAFGDRGAVVIFDGTTPNPPQTVRC